MRFIGAIISIILLSGSIAFAEDQAKPITGRWVVIETKKGTIKFALYEKDMPNTTKNFIELADRKFYDGLMFHRVVPGFVVQGGDPNGDGSGNSGKRIKLETSPKLKHDSEGIVAMARQRDPDSASCQFYFTLGPAPWLDELGYAIFGKVTEGMDVVKKLEIGDVMRTVRIVAAPAEKKPAAKPASKPKPKK